MQRKALLAILPLAAAGGLLAGWSGRVREEQHVERLWQRLTSTDPGDAPLYDSAMLDGLPAPARRYLARAIAPGTPLAGSIRVTMTGAMRLQPEGALMPLTADELLVPPHALVWRARVGDGAIRFRGFDLYDVPQGRGAMRWWLYGALPLVRAEGPDIARSAAGRLAGEAVWLPSALLPGRGVTWQAIDDSSASFTMRVADEDVVTTIVVGPEGRLIRVSLERWREDAADGRPGYLPFVVDEWDEERTFGGYTIPTRFRAGWRLGEPDAVPFFYAQLQTAEFR
jgi:hypothetical protein